MKLDPGEGVSITGAAVAAGEQIVAVNTAKIKPDVIFVSLFFMGSFTR